MSTTTETTEKADGVTKEQFLISEVARLQRIMDKPITHETELFVIFDNDPAVARCGLQQLFDGSTRGNKMSIFLNRDAADRHANRQNLLSLAKMRLRGLSDESLGRMVDALEDANVKELLQLVERCLSP